MNIIPNNPTESYWNIKSNDIIPPKTLTPVPKQRKCIGSVSTDPPLSLCLGIIDVLGNLVMLK